MEIQGIQNSQNNLEEKNKIGGHTLPFLQVYYTATVIQTVWCWCTDKSMEQNINSRNKLSYLWLTFFFF